MESQMILCAPLAFSTAVLSPAANDEGGESQSLIITAPNELVDVNLLDALGRTLVTSLDQGQIHPDALRAALMPLPSGVYYLRGIDREGEVQTIAIAHAK